MSKRQTQLTLDLKDKKTPDTHGGEGYKNLGKRKPERPFDPCKPLHITMKSSMAKGERSMLHPVRAKIIQNIVFRTAKRVGSIEAAFALRALQMKKTKVKQKFRASI